MIELQDIFEEFGDAYRSSNILSLARGKAVNAIRNCRTAKLGGHLDVCDDCGQYKVSYNSCRNRNCPKCGNMKKEQWVLDRKTELLPISHFHAVFTVPDTMHPLFQANEARMYSLLFKAVSQTLTSLARDKRHLGAEIGITAVLHTWGQTLAYHPHIHCIVPGGGLSDSGISFMKSRDKFFLPVLVLSNLFRGKLLAFVKSDLLAGKLIMPGSHERGWNAEAQLLLDNLYKKKWVVYCKKPFRNPDTVVEYLSRYTHKTAIYNQRLVSMDKDGISFKWKDYREKNAKKIMTLEPQEFIRRFMMHVLPSGFQRIRHYGLLSNRNRTTKLKKCFKLLKVKQPEKKKMSVGEMLMMTKGIDIMKCPDCGGHWVRIRSYLPLTS